MGFTLFIVAIVLTVIFGPIGILVSLIHYAITLNFPGMFGALDNMFKAVAVAIDKLGAIVCASLFNYTLITKEGFQFGIPGLTVSYVLGVNQIEATLTLTGKVLVYILDVVENLKFLISFLKGEGPYFRLSHVREAVKHQYLQDLQATKRAEELKRLLNRD